MIRARFFHLLVLIVLLATLAVPDPVIAQEPKPLQPSTAVLALQSMTAAEPQVISALGGSWFGSNIIQNGNAEETTPGTPSFGWSGGTNDFIQVQPYGSPDYPLPNDPGPMDRGQRFFRASKLALEINAWQSIDIAHLAATIDSGGIGFNMSGFFGGIGTSNDYALLRVYFEDACHHSLQGSSPVAIGSVKAADRGNQTGLLERSTQGNLPKGTRCLTFQLQMLRGGTANPDALADNLSFIMQRPKVMLPMVVGSSGQPNRAVPAAPTNLLAAGDSLTTMKLTWNDNANTETGYLIERAPGGTTNYVAIYRTAQNVHEYRDGGLTPQANYTYRVSAFNDAGSSTPATVTGATFINPTTLPARPASCWTSNTSAISTVVGWTDSSNNEEYFILDMMYENYLWVTLAHIEPGATYVIVTDIQPGINFYFRITAHNAAGNSTSCVTPAARTVPVASGTFVTFENATSYAIAYLAVDGINEFPVYPMGIMEGGSYQISLPAGHHTFEIRTGFWQDQTHRFDMYTYYADYDLPNGEHTLTIEDVTLEGILTQFDPSGEGYWEGYYFDASINCHTAAFRFHDDGTYKFYVGNVQQGTGSYSLKQRLPETFSLKFNVPGYEGYLIETHGEFYMKNGPPGWQQITYNYKPQGYVYNPFCP